MSDRARRRAARMFRLYPRRWRVQFPDFEETLAAEFAAERRGVRCNTLAAAGVEWLRDLGVVPKTSVDRVGSGLALIYAALIPFVALALGMWSQLHTGLASPSAAVAPALSASDLFLAIGAVAVALVLPIGILFVSVGVWRNRRAAANQVGLCDRSVVRPALVFLGSIALLTLAGWGAERSRWYSPAAAALPHRGPGLFLTLWVRGIVASVTPAWVHPTTFAQMPKGQLIAALLAPLAALVAASALFCLLTRVRLPRFGRANLFLGGGAAAMMSVSVAACGRWLIEHPGREGGTTLQAHADQLAPGHTGWMVVILLAALASVALVGLRRVLRGDPAAPLFSVS
jgi:hypothetical protein